MQTAITTLKCPVYGIISSTIIDLFNLISKFNQCMHLYSESLRTIYFAPEILWQDYFKRVLKTKLGLLGLNNSAKWPKIRHYFTGKTQNIILFHWSTKFSNDFFLLQQNKFCNSSLFGFLLRLILCFGFFLTLAWFCANWTVSLVHSIETSLSGPVDHEVLTSWTVDLIDLFAVIIRETLHLEKEGREQSL